MKQPFLSITFAARFKKNYAAYPLRDHARIDDLIMALCKGAHTPGMRVKPIEPGKVYFEARVNDGDRLIFRVENDTLHVVDVVPHDWIGKYNG